MKVSFLIPAYNEAQGLPKLLSLLNDYRQRLDTPSEIIVCNNNSSDETATIARSLGARVIDESINQISKARNRAASIAEGELFIFIDADTWPSLELIQYSIALLESGHWLGGGSVIRFDDGVWDGILGIAFWSFISRIFRLAAGSFLFVRRDAFHDLNGFNESLFASEEIDFSIRAKRLAKERQLQWRILNQFPVLTSGRKMKLYTFRERMRILFSFFLKGRKFIEDRDQCRFWYDGRR